jgi:hypothetical protein
MSSGGLILFFKACSNLSLFLQNYRSPMGNVPKGKRNNNNKSLSSQTSWDRLEIKPNQSHENQKVKKEKSRKILT